MQRLGCTCIQPRSAWPGPTVAQSPLDSPAPQQPHRAVQLLQQAGVSPCQLAGLLETGLHKQGIQGARRRRLLLLCLLQLQGSSGGCQPSQQVTAMRAALSRDVGWHVCAAGVVQGARVWLIQWGHVAKHACRDRQAETPPPPHRVCHTASGCTAAHCGCTPMRGWYAVCSYQRACRLQRQGVPRARHGRARHGQPARAAGKTPPPFKRWCEGDKAVREAARRQCGHEGSWVNSSGVQVKSTFLPVFSPPFIQSWLRSAPHRFGECGSSSSSGSNDNANSRGCSSGGRGCSASPPG